MVFKRRIPFFVTFIFCVSILSCGRAPEEGNDNIPTGSAAPILLKIDPATSGPGKTIKLTGVGFSIVPEENIIILGGANLQAKTYGVTEDGKEQLTFDIPANASLGETSLVVIVDSEPSNALSFSVTP